MSDLSDERFPKNEHLRKSREFKKVITEGASLRRGNISFFWLPNGLKRNRVGISISSRGIKQAVRRNRIKRLFREAFRRTKRLQRVGFDIVLIVKRDFLQMDFSSEKAKKIFLSMVKESRILS